MYKPHLIKFVMVNGREQTVAVNPETRTVPGSEHPSGRETLSPIESVRRAFADRGLFPFFTRNRPGFIVLANVCQFWDLGEVEDQ
jgi:hypothetical protein